MGFIDIHHHVNYGMDDGAGSIETSMRMLEKAYKDGVTDIIATTHALSGRALFDIDRYYRHMDALTARCVERGLPVRLYDGCEILYSDSTVNDLKLHRFPTLAGSRFVLIEFDIDISFDTLTNAVRMIDNAGYTPVLAHIERYDCLMRSLDRVREVRKFYDARIQVNARTFLKPRGFLLRRTLDALMREGLVDYIASDAHNLDTRCVCMRDAYTLLKKEFGRERAFQWFAGNQMELFE